MSWTRRQFLQRTAAGAAGLWLGPSLFRGPWVDQALAATGDRYFLLLFLDGGNDGLNTIVPADNTGGIRDHYQAARGTGSGGLRLPDSSLLVPSTVPMRNPGTGAQLGFHPGLGGLYRLYEQGRVAVVQGCGYPDPNLSHDVSATIWATGTPGGPASSSGWMGRYLAAQFGPTEIPAASIGYRAASELMQSTTSVLSLRRLSRFGFPLDDQVPDDAGARRNAFLALYQAAASSSHALTAVLGTAGEATLVASESYPPLDALYKADRPSWNDGYSTLGTSTARDLREVAKIIYGRETGQPNIGARIFQVRNGGYDTHSDQGTDQPGDRHYDLLAEIGDALELFYQDCADMGVAERICILVWSEFGRRVPQNQNGTDHGTQGPVFVLGGAVNGGLYGNHPNIEPAALDESGNTVYSQAAGDPWRSTDIRDVYGTVLKHWFGLTDAVILNSMLSLDTGDPAHSWTVPDFDLGFL